MSVRNNINQFRKFRMIVLVSVFIGLSQASSWYHDRQSGGLAESHFKSENILSIKYFRKMLPQTSENNQLANFLDTLIEEKPEKSETMAVITNLGEYIEPFGQQSCFVVINNFNGINILGVKYPVLIRFPKLTVISFNRSWGEYYEYFWVPHNMHPTNGTRNAEDVMKKRCTLSKYFASYFLGDDYIRFFDCCIRIIFERFTSATKPWLCQAQLGLFPTMGLYGPNSPFRYYSYTFQFLRHTGGTKTRIPSNIPKINFFVTRESSSTESNLISFQTLIASTYNEYSYESSVVSSYISNEAFFHGVATPTSRNKLVNPIFYLKFIKLVRITYNGTIKSGSAGLILVRYSNKNFLPENISQVTTLSSSSSPKETMTWIVNKFLGDHCGSKSKTGNPGTVKSLFEPIAHVWFSILQNYTFKIQNVNICKNGKIYKESFSAHSNFKNSLIHLRWDIQMKMIYPRTQMTAKYINPLVNLRFITCDNLNVEALPFKELVNVYQPWVWASIVLAMFALSATLSMFARKGSLVRNLLATYKVVVGQNDPFLNRVFNSSPLRFAVVAFLFMGVVLSEGYKNSNMYNIIMPRRVIQKERFSELVADNFTVYVKSAEINLVSNWDVNVEEAEIDLEVDGQVITATENIIFLQSDLMQIDEAGIKHVLYKSLFHQTTLHPQLVHFLRETLIKLKHWFVKSDLDKKYEEAENLGKPLEKEVFEELLKTQTFIEQKRNKEFREIVRKWEEDKLLSFMQKCSKSALILPERLCEKYAKKLRISQNKHISIGKETYQPRPMGVFLRGLIPPVIIKRIKSIDSSGIWDWHLQLAPTRTKFGSQSNLHPTGATMTGNVMVIFLMLPFGFASSSIALIVELCLFKLRKLSMKIHETEVQYPFRKFHVELHRMIRTVTDFAIVFAEYDDVWHHRAPR